MGDEWGRDPNPNSNPHSGGSNPDEIDKRIEDVKRILSQSQERLKRVVNKAGEYLQQVQTTPPPPPRQAATGEEQRIRQLINIWSNENWRVAKDLGTYMDLVSWRTDEVWEVTVQTRWETRTMESVTEPYTGHQASKPQPLLPVWDYELPEVTGLKGPQSRIRLEGLDDTIACAACNGTGRALCANCNGRGWIVCPDCKGRTKKRCNSCRGRGYIADWSHAEKKPFFQKQAENVANSVGERVADVFDGIRQQGVPIPNPLDMDPAGKGPTIPCPDCVNGEVDCTCGNGKRVCSVCQGAKSSLCAQCGGTGKIARRRELVRRFDLHTQMRTVGESAIPKPQLASAGGDLVYSAEVKEELYPEAPPEDVPMDVWRTTVDLVKAESQATPVPETSQSSSHATLQVIELVRVPYTKVQYRYSDQDYVLYIYDGEGHEKFYAERFPARWDRVERLVRAISNDLLAWGPEDTPRSGNSRTENPHETGYRIHIEVPPYDNIEDEERPK